MKDLIDMFDMYFAKKIHKVEFLNIDFKFWHGLTQSILKVSKLYFAILWTNDSWVGSQCKHRH